MDYDPEQDGDDQAQDRRDRAGTNDPMDRIMELYGQYREDGSLPVQTTELEPGRGELYAFPEAAYEEGDEDAVGRFTSVILNHTGIETYEHDQAEPPLAELGFDLFPGRHLIASVDIDALAPYAVGRVTNQATAVGGDHNAFGYQSDGRLHNEGTVEGNMAEHSYGIAINDGTVTGSMARDGWEQKPTSDPTSINRGTVAGLQGTGTDGLHINLGTVESWSRAGGLEGIYINLGDIDPVFEDSTLLPDEQKDGVLIDPTMDAERFEDAAATVIGGQTLDEHPELEQYIRAWKDVAERPVDELFTALEDLDPDYDPAQRRPFTSLTAMRLIGVDQHGDRDRMQRAEHELRSRQQPHPGRYVEAVVREELGLDQRPGIEHQDIEAHRDALQEYGDR